MKDGTIFKLKVGTLLLTIAGMGVVYGRDYYINQNLEDRAIACSIMANLRPVINTNLPLIRNKDLDGNGKYESVLFYEDSNDRIVYQEITKNDNGVLVLDNPNFYE